MAAMISAFELRELRTATERLMPGTVVVSRSTMVSDGVGGYVASAPVPVGTFICRVVYQRTQPEAGVRTGRLEGHPDVYVYVPALSEVQRDDVLAVEGGETYVATSVHSRGAAGYEVSRRCACFRRV